MSVLAFTQPGDLHSTTAGSENRTEFGSIVTQIEQEGCDLPAFAALPPGQQEDGPVGYSRATLDGGLVSWRGHRLDEPGTQLGPRRGREC